MANYAYVAVDWAGGETRGSIDVSTPLEAVQRIKEMGLFPTKVIASDPRKQTRPISVHNRSRSQRAVLRLPLWRGVPTPRLCVFTRQLATLIQAGMPLLRGLRVLEEQEEHSRLKKIIREVTLSIEEGQSLTEALSAHPKIFNRLYVSMVKAGEIGGALDVTLTRLSEFMAKAQRIKNRIKAAMFYPCSVLVVATVITGLLMGYVVPRFQAIFTDLMEGRQLPAFTLFVFGISHFIANHLWLGLTIAAAAVAAVMLSLKTRWGRWAFDWLKLNAPLIGKLFRKAAISRFSRTLGTLTSNGVPILQALTIVEETSGNVHVGSVVARVRESVKEGEPVAPTLKKSSLFPAIVTGMVDVGEQTGALSEMLFRIADNYDDEVDNTTNGLMSLLEPVMIIFLAVVVGGIVIAMFLPLISFDAPAPNQGE